MEVQSVSHRPFYSGQSLRDREIVCPKVNRAAKNCKPRQRSNSVSFLKRTFGADELILNKKTKNADNLKKIIKNREQEVEEANDRRIIASSILAGLVFASGYIICKKGGA